MLVSCSTCQVLSVWTHCWVQHSRRVPMKSELSISIFIPNDDLVKRKTLTRNQFICWWRPTQAADLGTSVNFFEDSCGFGPHFYFFVSSPPTCGEFLVSDPGHGLDSSTVIVAGNDLIFPEIIDVNFVIIAPSTNKSISLFDPAYFLWVCLLHLVGQLLCLFCPGVERT